jgi:hypothetical protein
MDIIDKITDAMTGITDFGTNPVFVDARNEITTLRQEVAEISKHRDELLKHIGERALTPTGLEQLALHEIEIIKLRKTLGNVISENVANREYNSKKALYETTEEVKAKQALSTPLTTKHLNEWLKEKIGEPVGELSVDYQGFSAYSRKKDLPTGYHNLYTVKESE